jgi:hypothetical protein
MQGQQQQQGGFNQLLGTLVRFGLMWYVMNMFKGNQQPAGKSPADMSAPLYRKGDLLDMYVYVSEAPFFEPSRAELIWTQTEVGLATTAERKFTWEYTPSEVCTWGEDPTTLCRVQQASHEQCEGGALPGSQ